MRRGADCAGARGAVRRALALATAVCVIPASGCIYQRYVTNTARGSTEQLLVSQAIERAAARLELPDVAGRAITVETVSLAPEEATFLRSVVEARLRAAGARVVERAEAEQVLVLVAGVLGTTSRDTAFGVPPIPLGTGYVIPGLQIFSILKQRGYASVRLISHTPDGAHVAESPNVIDRASFEVWSFLFVAYRTNDIYPGEGREVGLD